MILACAPRDGITIPSPGFGLARGSQPESEEKFSFAVRYVKGVALHQGTEQDETLAAIKSAREGANRIYHGKRPG